MDQNLSFFAFALVCPLIWQADQFWRNGGLRTWSAQEKGPVKPNATGLLSISTYLSASFPLSPSYDILQPNQPSIGYPPYPWPSLNRSHINKCCLLDFYVACLVIESWDVEGSSGMGWWISSLRQGIVSALSAISQRLFCPEGANCKHAVVRWPSLDLPCFVRHASKINSEYHPCQPTLANIWPLLGFRQITHQPLRTFVKGICLWGWCFSQPQSITQEGVHTHPLTARECEHWFLQHLSHF